MGLYGRDTVGTAALYGGQNHCCYKMSVLGKQMAQMNETLTATEVILKTDQAYALVVKAKEMKVVADAYHTVLTELKKNVEVHTNTV